MKQCYSSWGKYKEKQHLFGWARIEKNCHHFDKNGKKKAKAYSSEWLKQGKKKLNILECECKEKFAKNMKERSSAPKLTTFTGGIGIKLNEKSQDKVLGSVNGFPKIF